MEFYALIFFVIFFVFLAVVIVGIYSDMSHKPPAATSLQLQGDVRISYVGRVYKLKPGYHLTVVVGSDYVFVDSHTGERICGYHTRYETWITAVSGKWVMDKRGFKHMGFDDVIRLRKQAGDEVPFLKVPLMSPPENPETTE